MIGEAGVIPLSEILEGECCQGCGRPTLAIDSARIWGRRGAVWSGLLSGAVRVWGGDGHQRRRVPLRSGASLTGPHARAGNIGISRKNKAPAKVTAFSQARTKRG
jgi:hypothetical protein